MTEEKVLITGTAGFVGFHTARRFLDAGFMVLGVDSMNQYYDVSLKLKRKEILKGYSGYQHAEFPIETGERLLNELDAFRPDYVIHLAAQAGVRYSVTNPEAYVSSNLVGTFKVLEACRVYGIKHLLMASTSSVYGASNEPVFSENDKTDFPLSFYASTKKATEAMAHSYAYMYRLPVTAFRFFTVYGPWGRPDMALFKFADAIKAGEAIDVYNNGHMTRDFTYIDDLVEAIFLLRNKMPLKESSSNIDNSRDSVSEVAPYRVVNIGRGNERALMDAIAILEDALGAKAKKNYLPMQIGDVKSTTADASLLRELTGFSPVIDIEEGIKRFVDWYSSYRTSKTNQYEGV